MAQLQILDLTEQEKRLVNAAYMETYGKVKAERGPVPEDDLVTMADVRTDATLRTRGLSELADRLSDLGITASDVHGLVEQGPQVAIQEEEQAADQDLLDTDFLEMENAFVPDDQPQREEAPAQTPGEVNIFASTGEHPELSNFAVRPFIGVVDTFSYHGVGLENLTYPMFNFDSVEQAFQYAKSIYSDGPLDRVQQIRDAILETTDGPALRALGRDIPNLNRREWDAVALNYMDYFLRQSFSQNREAQEALLATGDATLTHNQDNSRWRMEFPRLLTTIRAELAEGKSIARNLNEGMAPQPISVNPANRMLAQEAERYDILTLGTGRRSEEEFYSMIPPGTTMILDARNYRRNTRYPQFDEKNLIAGVAARGLKYEWEKPLSGKDSRFPLHGNEKLTDWHRLVETESFRDSLDHVKELAAHGEKIVIISGESDPRYGQRALLLGQMLESSTDMLVGHIDSTNDGQVLIKSNREVVERSIGSNIRIDGGSYINFHFQSDRSYVADDGVTVTRLQRNIPAEQRMIAGNWNNGKKVDIRLVTEGETLEGADPKSFKATYIENARNADVTVVFSIGSLDRETSMAQKAAEGKLVTVNVRNTHVQTGEEEQPRMLTVKDLLGSPEYMDTVADRLRDRIQRNLTLRALQTEEPEFDFDHLKVHVAGTDMARIANEVRVSSAQEDLTGMDIEAMAAGGLHLEYTDISQEDVNAFIRGVLERVQKPVALSDVLDEDQQRQFTITDIITNGNTGVAEAATIAAQMMDGLEAHVVAPQDFRMTIDNETSHGLTVGDAAMFANRFHQGLRNDVTLDDLRAGIDRQKNEDRVHEESAGVQYGLNDMQILTLQRLGFNNTDLVTMAEIASDNKVVITGDNDLMEFLENASGYGIAGVEYITVDAIAAKRGEVEKLVEEAAEQGIGFITLTNSHYPENLRLMEDSTHREYDERVITHNITDEEAVKLLDGITEDGVLHTDRIPAELIEDGTVEIERIPREVTDRRPAILWYQGDINLLDSTTESIHGDYVSMEETISAARDLGVHNANEDITPVTALHQGPASVSVAETLDRGGKAIAVSPDGVDGPEMDGLKEKTVRKGGLVVSEKGPGEQEPDKKSGKRTEKVAAALGYANAFIDGLSSSQSNNDIEKTVIDTLNIGNALSLGVFSLAATKLSAGKKKSGVENVTRADMDKITGSARNAHGVGSEAIVADSEEMANGPAQGPVTKHPRQHPVDVIHMGKERVFLVADNYPDVIASLKSTFGENIRIADPKDRERIYNRFLHKTVSVDGDSMNAFEGYRGTQPQEREPYVSTLYFIDGEIKSLQTAPNTASNLIPKRDRLNNIILFEQLKRTAKEMQGEMQKMAGLPTRRGYRFENADYLVIKKNSVEIRRGDDLRARVFLAKNGEIRVENVPSCKPDLQEHYQRDFPVFDLTVGTDEKKRGSRTSAAVTESSMKDIISNMRDCIFELPRSEAQAFAPGSREEEQQLQEEIASGFLKVRESNIAEAILDVAEGQRLGLIGDGNGETVDRTTAMAFLTRETAACEKKMKELDKVIASTKKELENESLTNEEKDAIEDKLDGLQSEKLKAAARAKYIGDHKADIALADNITINSVEGKDYAKAVEIEGLVIPLTRTNKLTDRMMLEASALVQKLEKYYDDMAQSQSAPKPAPEPEPQDTGKQEAPEQKPEPAPEQTVTESVSVEAGSRREVKETPVGRKAAPEDVIASLSSGTCIVKVGDKQAIADKDLNIRGDMYDNIRPAGTTYCYAFDSGKFKLIHPNGEVVLPVWLEGLSKPQDGISIVRSGGVYNLLNLREGKLLGETWYKSVGQIRDGWSMVQNKEGRYNYVSPAGKLMTTKWFDSANEFSSGLALITRDGVTAKINNKGKVLDVLNQDKSNGMGGPGKN